MNQHSRDHGDGIGAGAAEGHEVEEAVHEGTSVHQQDEDQADAQQEDIGQDGLLMAIHIGEGLGQEVLLTHGVHHAHGGHPEAQDGSGHAQQHGDHSVDHGPYAPAKQILHRADGHEARIANAVSQQHSGLVQAGHTEEEDRVDHAAGQHGTADGLLGVADGEVAFLHHLRHGFKAEVGGDQQRHTDDPAGDTAGGFDIGEVEHTSQVADAPVTRGQHQHGGQQCGGDVGKQAEGLHLDQEGDVLHAHGKYQQQDHNADAHNANGGDGQAEDFLKEGSDGHAHSRGNGDPGSHDQPGGQEAHVLVHAHGVVDQFAAGGVEQRRKLAVHQRNGQDRQRHQREGQEGARAAVREEHGIPVANVGEDGACRNGVDEDQAQTLFESTLFLFD